jgi:type II secretory pathway pseudopilin PulG
LLISEEEAMFCYKCGASMAEQSVVCPQCGTPVQSVSQPGTVLQESPRPGTSAVPQSPQPGLAQPVSPWLNVPPVPAYTGEQETEGKAVGSLILGILAIFPLGLLAGIPAVVLGHLAKANIRKGLGRLKGDGMATAGLIMGYISLAAIPLVLIIAAIAIPSFMRARIAANESGAAATVRTLNTSVISYSLTYPTAGYPASLAVLGPGVPPVACSNTPDMNAQHACLIEAVLACSQSWCTKNGYKYHLTAICSGATCTDYVITATPVNPGMGSKSFCSSNDAVIRSTRGAVFEPLETPEQCAGWAAI